MTGDWQAVADTVRKRMAERKISTEELSRRTDLSPTTIRAVRQGRPTARNPRWWLLPLAWDSRYSISGRC
jgi:hypothetical protein